MTRLILNYPIERSKNLDVKGEELHYLVRVRRCKKGDVVEVRDSQGRSFGATVARVDQEKAILELGDEVPSARTVWPVSLIVAPPKGNLMDDVIRKLSELGAARVVPAICERSVVHPGDTKVDRWRRIARESRRQSGRDIPLEVGQVRPLEQALEELKGSNLAMLLHPAGKAFPFYPGARPSDESICVAVGPEGGFTAAETEIAEKLGFSPVALGASILRIETATIAAAVLCLALLGAYMGSGTSTCNFCVNMR